MILQKHKREAGIAKLKRTDYREFKRVIDLQGCFEEAMKAGDQHYMNYYDREIDKTFRRSGVAE